MSGETEGTSASVSERVQAAGQLAQTMGQAGMAKLRSSFGGFGKSRAAAGTKDEGTAGQDGGGTLAIDAGKAAAIKGALRERLTRLTGSRLMLNGAIGFLVLLAVAQWSLIVFNYWR